jgi:adenine-specific DNA glycosylase
MKSDNKPYSLGFNGHAKCCDCADCAKARAERVSKLWEANGSYARPKTVDSTIFVRSYFRRQPNHLKKFPNTRRLMQALVRDIKKLPGDEG